MQKCILLSLLCILVGCASTMPGREVDTGSKKVTATIADNAVFSSERIQMHQFSIKNNTNDWLEFEGAVIEAPAEVKVLVGDHITSWVEACTLEKNVSDYNTSLLLGSLAVTGAVIAGTSNHQSTATTGAVLALGSIGAASVKEYQNSKRRIEFQEAFPEKHIFRSFVLPPGKVIQRWILIENPEGKSFKLKSKTKAGDELNIKVQKDKVVPALI